MQPFSKLEQLYHGISKRLSNADHDFMIHGGDGPRSSKSRVRPATFLLDKNESVYPIPKIVAI